MLKSQKIAESVLHGEHARRKPGTGENFWQFREYIPTDRPQDIDWRQSAKGDNIYIKQKEWLVTRKVLFWCAGGKSMNFGSNPENPFYTKQENAQIMCLALALLLQRSYEQIGIYGGGRAGRSELAMERLGQYLLDRSHAKPEDGSLPDTTSSTLPRHAIFIGVGDFLSPIEEIEARFDILGQQTKNALIIQTLDPAEIYLGFSGRVRFKGIAAEEEIINNVSNIRENYKQRITNHIKQIEALCVRYNWNYQLHCTDKDIGYTLKAIWESIERGNVRK
jgi:uncharacterized protein (DUF58 family)